MAMLAAVSALLSSVDSGVKISVAGVPHQPETHKILLENVDDDAEGHFWANIACCSRSPKSVFENAPADQLDDNEEDTWLAKFVRRRGSSWWSFEPHDLDTIATDETTSSCLDLDSPGSHEIFPEFSPTSLSSEVHSALLHNIQPQAISDGMGGVYLMLDCDSRPAAIFKPGDEEVGCTSNPKGYAPTRMEAARTGIAPGTAIYREVAASLLDHGHFANVPHTTLTTCSSDVFRGSDPKLGSLQQFVSSRCCAGDLGTSMYNTRDVHAIAILDMRLLNLDRHDGNILMCEDTDGLRMTPIDHGCCLPSRLCVNDYEWAWLSWPQLHTPLTPETQRYVADLDPDSDESLLSDLPLPAASLRVLFVMTIVLQAGVAAGLTLYEIATLVARKNDEPSLVERMVARCRWVAASRSVSRRTSYEKEFRASVRGAVTALVAASPIRK